MDFNFFLNIFIAAVWVGFGLFCKVLGLVPRQQEIVARILGARHAWLITKLIGTAEICMAFWILTGYQSRLNAVLQILIVAIMNVIEFVLAKDLLLFGPTYTLISSPIRIGMPTSADCASARMPLTTPSDL